MVARNKMLIEGTLGASNVEVWSTGINYVGAAGATVQSAEDLTTWAQAAMDLFSDFSTYTALGNLLSTSGKVVTVTAQYFDAAGILVQQGISDPDPTPGISTLECPFTTSVVMSMRTGVPGGSFRGRNYWPALGAAISPDGVLAGTFNAAALAANWAQLMSDISDAAPGALDMRPVVYSPSKDVVTAVTQVLVGDVPDTQRRRRDALLETYSSATYPPA